MRKLRFTIILLLLLGLNLKAQDNDYEAGEWYFGPHIGVSIGSFSGSVPCAFVWGYDAGAYVGYSFTERIGVNISALYDNEYYSKLRIDYLKFPTLFLLQFKSNHLGLGFQYNHALKKQDDLGYSSYNNRYLSGIIEFGYVFFYSGDAIASGVRSLIRVGYAITPRTYTLEGIDKTYKLYPYFAEIAFQYNMGQYFGEEKIRRRNKYNR